MRYQYETALGMLLEPLQTQKLGIGWNSYLNL